MTILMFKLTKIDLLTLQLHIEHMEAQTFKFTQSNTTAHKNKSTNSSHTFKLSQTEVAHTSQYQIEPDDDNDHSIKKKKRLTHSEGNKLTKTTSVTIGGKLITIIDSYSSNGMLQSITSNIKLKNMEMEKQIRINTNKDKVVDQLADKAKRQGYQGNKNVIKNIFKLFLKWLEVNYSSYLNFNSGLSKMISEKRGFNLGLVNDVAKKSQLRRAFLDFCEEDADELIEYSKIIDKKKYLLALEKYKRNFQQAQNLDNSISASSDDYSEDEQESEHISKDDQKDKADHNNKQEDLVSILVMNSLNHPLTYQPI